MKTLISMTVLSLALSSSFAHAFPKIPQNVLAKATVRHAKASIRDTPATCTDFTGNWSGVCHQAGQPDTGATTSISQVGCSVLISDGEGTAIGGLEDLNDAFAYTDQGGENIGVASHTVSSVDWSADGTTLAIQSIVTARALGLGSPFADAIEVTAAVVGGQLQIGFSDTAGLLPPTNCVYSRQ